MRELKYLVAVALLAMSAVLMAGAAYGADGWTKTAQSIPSWLVWDATGAASVDATNSGTNTWDSTYALVSVEGATAAAFWVDRWGLTAVPVTGTVAHGASYAWDFNVTAPPITTLAYVASVSPTDSPVMASLDCNWMLAHPYTPTSTPTLVTTDTAQQETTITRFPDDGPGSSGEWAAAWIEELTGRMPLVVLGYPDGTYRPAVVVTRDQMAVYMVRALNLPTAAYDHHVDFPADVPVSQWAFPWIEAMYDAGLVYGYGGGYYEPGWNVDRAQMAVYVARGICLAEGVVVPSGPLVPTFSDVPGWTPGPPHWAYDQIEFCVAHYVVRGYGDGTYRPDGNLTGYSANNVTRDQMAVFIWKGFVMPTGAVVVLAGPAVTAVDPGTAGYDGWSSVATGAQANPGYAYIALDVLRLDADLAPLAVKFELRKATTPTEPATGSYTTTVTLSASDINTAKTAAEASGNAYHYVSWDIPSGLAKDDYILVVSVGGLEIRRQPSFTID